LHNESNLAQIDTVWITLSTYMRTIKKNPNELDFLTTKLKKTHDRKYALRGYLLEISSNKIPFDNSLNDANVGYFCANRSQIGDSLGALYKTRLRTFGSIVCRNWQIV